MNDRDLIRRTGVYRLLDDDIRNARDARPLAYAAANACGNSPSEPLP